jgi:hypothetical protein
MSKNVCGCELKMLIKEGKPMTHGLISYSEEL